MKKNNRYFIIGLIIPLLAVFFIGLFFVDIGINSKFFIKKHFNQAFEYRITGDCVSFIDYVYQDSGIWNQKCEKEKSRQEYGVIGRFKIIAITYKLGSDTAFLQVEVTRDSSRGGMYTNLENYVMKKSGLIWKIRSERK